MEWANWYKIFNNQPISRIAQYYGQKIGNLNNFEECIEEMNDVECCVNKSICFQDSISFILGFTPRCSLFPQSLVSLPFSLERSLLAIAISINHRKNHLIDLMKFQAFLIWRSLVLHQLIFCILDSMFVMKLEPETSRCVLTVKFIARIGS